MSQQVNNALKSAVKVALAPYAGRGWTVQMTVLGNDTFTVLVGKYDPDTLEGEGVRCSASLVRASNKIVVDLVNVF
jgi:hypothetical protein